MTIIGLKELSQNAGKIAKRVEAGETFTVVRRSVPIFNITPAKKETSANEIQETIDWTENFVKEHQKAFDELAQK